MKGSYPKTFLPSFYKETESHSSEYALSRFGETAWYFINNSSIFNQYEIVIKLTIVEKFNFLWSETDAYWNCTSEKILAYFLF